MKESINRTFNHFKIHTQYSICEGAVKIDKLKDYCKKHKIKSLGLSDTYNLSGALEFSENLSSIGTQPIIGTQILFKYKNHFGLIPLIAKNNQGYKNLIKLSSKSYLENPESTDPHCDLNDLVNSSEGIIVLTGSIKCMIGSLFNIGLLKEIEEILFMLKETFNNNIYIEIQRHNDLNEKEFENYNLNISKKLQLPIIASNEVYYLDKEMFDAHDALMCIGEKTYVNDKNRVKLSNQHYFKSSKEMTELFKDLPEALENNYNLPFRCSFKPNSSKPILPNISSSDKDANEILIQESNEGLKHKFKLLFDLEINDYENNNKYLLYKKRLDHEVKIIVEMNYSSYFLIVSDYIKWAKHRKIPVGPGRGSGAGSLVAWCLSITDIDPIKFNLIFERFLNPDRISMPDFDIDFCEEKRDLVFKYLTTKYKDSVAHIITFGKLKARMVIRDVGRVLGLPYGFIDSICKMIPFDPSRPMSLQECINIEPRLQNLIKEDKRVERLVNLSLKLEGLNRNIATHAAGVVIADKKLTESVPLYKDNSANLLLPSTQFDMYSAENAGLIKFDFLGLKTLTVIDKAQKLVNKKDPTFKIEKINYEDQKVYNLLSSGKTVGLFQLESSGMKDALINMRPNRLEDIIALVALYRPGPMSNISIYNECKNGKREPDYLHPKLEQILKPTYGVIIYQEQVMQIAQTLAGFSAGEADILRRAMGKKKRAELEEQKERFINGALKKGIKKDIASYIFTKIEPFAEYGFNKSHAAAYALIAYQTAYLKTYFKEEFIAATMSTELTNTSKLREFVEELKRLKVEVVRPSINSCFGDFKAEKNKIYYGLGAIKSVGFEAVSNLVNERIEKGKYKSLLDFIKRVSPKDINKLQLEGLVKSGAFDDIEKNRNAIIQSIPKIIQLNKIYFEEKISNQSNLFNDQTENNEEKFELQTSKSWSKKELLNEEFKSLGFYISDHPLNDYEKIFEQLRILPFKEYYNNENNEGQVAGTLMSIQEKKTLKGTPYAIAKFSDKMGEFELFLFSEILTKNREILKEGESFVLTLFKELDKDQKRINVKKIVSLNELVNQEYKKVSIEIDEVSNLENFSQLIKEKGKTEIELIFKRTNNKFIFKLENPRKFDLKLFNIVKSKEYVKKIRF